jgi:hypothetical protein
MKPASDIRFSNHVRGPELGTIPAVPTALTVGGCSSVADDDMRDGKDDFLRMLRAHNPGTKYIALPDDRFGRRTNRNNSMACLVYLRALEQVTHEGGVRFAEDSMAAQAMLSWPCEGQGDDIAARC